VTISSPTAVRTPTVISDARASMLRDGPILATLVRLSFPNLIAMCSAAIVSIAETAYVGSLGVASLGGIALAFPFFMLMQMLSAGAMGGTRFGRDQPAHWAAVIMTGLKLSHCVPLRLVLALACSSRWRYCSVAPIIFRNLGGSGQVLTEALAFSTVAAFAIIPIWATNMLASVARGSGNMAFPATTLLVAGLVQVAVGGTLGLGIDAAMACDDRIIIVNQHRIYKTKSLYAGSDLLYLFFRMCTRIARIGF
jgi:Na+-driven multidrug efflux pump